MNTATINFTLTAMQVLLENEGIDINSVKINIHNSNSENSLSQINLIDLIKISQKELAHIPQDSTRLDFIMENRIRIEKWNTNPSTQFYFVMNEYDESIAKELNGRDAIDAAIKYFESENSESSC